MRIPPALVGRLKPETLQQLQQQYANGAVNSLPAAFEKKLNELISRIVEGLPSGSLRKLKAFISEVDIRAAGYTGTAV